MMASNLHQRPLGITQEAYQPPGAHQKQQSSLHFVGGYSQASQCRPVGYHRTLTIPTTTPVGTYPILLPEHDSDQVSPVSPLGAEELPGKNPELVSPI